MNFNTAITTTNLHVHIGYSSILAIFILVGKWLVLEKMGEKGWKALIPIYSDYLIFKHVWNKKVFLAGILTGFIGAIALGTGMALETTYNPMAILVLFLLGMALIIVNLVIQFTCLGKLAHAFGHGIGYTLGLIFFEPIFMLLLGVRIDERYIG